MYKFTPILKTLVWGTESWVLSCVPGDESVVAEGPEAGKKIMLAGVNFLPDVFEYYEGAELEEQINKQIEIGEMEPFAVVVCDVNGLKKVNDEEGHAVGDQYIVRAAERMKQVFDPKTIYRSGGDEFIVILRNVSEKTLKQKAEAMRQIQENDEQISIAVGEFWNDGTVPLREAFQKADNAMYEEKRKYYQKA